MQDKQHRAKLTRANTVSAGRPTASSTQPTGVRRAARNARQVQQDLSERAERIRQRIEDLNRELLRLGREKRAAKKGSRTEAGYKKRAVEVLQQKRVLERRLQQTMNMSFNLGTVADNTEALHLAAEITPSTREAVGELRRIGTASTSGGLSMDELERLREEYQDTMMNVEEVGELLGQDLFDNNTIDHEELEAELDAELAQEGIVMGAAQNEGEDYLETLSAAQQIPGPYDQTPQEYKAPKREQDKRKPLFGRRLQRKGM